jgi:hypothetical protein
MSPETTGLGALHAELVRAFVWWNERRFHGQLPPVVFAFFPQPSNGGQGRLGHYLGASWNVQEEGEKRRAAEIILYADLCLQAGPRQVVQTLVHEMVHHWQACFGHPGKGHNREWHAAAALCGLKTEGPKGYTRPGPEFLLDFEAFGFRGESIPFRSLTARQRQKGKLRKWLCPSECNGSVRAGKSQVYLQCGVCGEMLTPAE